MAQMLFQASPIQCPTGPDLSFPNMTPKKIILACGGMVLEPIRVPSPGKLLHTHTHSLSSPCGLNPTGRMHEPSCETFCGIDQRFWQTQCLRQTPGGRSIQICRPNSWAACRDGHKSRSITHPNTRLPISVALEPWPRRAVLSSAPCFQSFHAGTSCPGLPFQLWGPRSGP